MVRMVTVQTQFIFQNCIEPEGTFSQTGSQIITLYVVLFVVSLRGHVELFLIHIYDWSTCILYIQRVHVICDN